jgi:hypothetical protein
MDRPRFAATLGPNIVRVMLTSLCCRTVQKLAHRRQNDELVASHSALTSTSPTPPESTSTPTLKPLDPPYNDDSTRKSTTSDYLKPIPVVLIPEEGESGDDTIEVLVKPLGSHDIPSKYATSNSTTKPSSRDRSTSPESGSIPVVYVPNANLLGEDASENDGGAGRDEQGEVEEGMYLKSKLWWLGMCLVALGEGGNFLSYGFAPASVVAPLGTVVSWLTQPCFQ